MLQEEEKPKKIGIFAHVLDGFGDSSICVRIFKYLAETFKKQAFRLALLEEDENQLLNFPELQSEAELYPSYPDFAANRYDLIIDYPIDVMSLNRELIFDHFFESDTPHLGLFEYGFQRYSVFANLILKLDRNSHSVTYGLGMDEGELGLIIDEDCYAYSSNTLSRTERLQLLAFLPQGLTHAIFNEPYSTKAIAKFSQDWILYFGYSSYGSSKDAFIQIITQMVGSGHSKICFVLVGMPFGLFQEDLNVETFASMLIKMESLMALGVGNIVAYFPKKHHNLEYQQKTLPLLAGAGITLKVISVPRIEHEHMKSLLMASEPEVLATGNLFFTEALMAGKHIVYELRMHTVNFIEDFIRASANFHFGLSTDLKTLLTGLKQIKSGERSVQALPSTLDEISTTLIKLRSNDFYLQNFVHQIYRDHHALRNIQELVKTLLGALPPKPPPKWLKPLWTPLLKRFVQNREFINNQGEIC